MALEWNSGRDQGGYYWQHLEAVCEHYHIDMDAPIRTIPAEKLKLILYGTGSQEVEVHIQGRERQIHLFGGI